MTAPVVRHLQPGPPPAGAVVWQLPLTAEERSRRRGRRRCGNGRELLLQLPRGGPLEPGQWLCSDGPPAHWVQVQAAAEPLLRVRASADLALLQAAYHLGNRHVALELHSHELRLLDDPVLAHLLEHRGLALERITAPFRPDTGAYGHAHGHDQGQGQAAVAAGREA